MSINMPNIFQLVKFEQGELDDDEIDELFQDGINNGWVWHLQGSYGRAAQQLINAGRCVSKGAS